jgi:hypothetical protein
MNLTRMAGIVDTVKPSRSVFGPAADAVRWGDAPLEVAEDLRPVELGQVGGDVL